MKRINMKRVVIGGFLLTSLCVLISISGCTSSNRSGRYQFVAHEPDPFVLDTVTGRAWPSTSGMLRNKKTAHGSGRIGRFKAVVTGSDSYIIDTATGRVWPRSAGGFRGSKK